MIEKAIDNINFRASGEDSMLPNIKFLLKSLAKRKNYEDIVYLLGRLDIYIEYINNFRDYCRQELDRLKS